MIVLKGIKGEIGLETLRKFAIEHKALHTFLFYCYPVLDAFLFIAVSLLQIPILSALVTQQLVIPDKPAL